MIPDDVIPKLQDQLAVLVRRHWDDIFATLDDEGESKFNLAAILTNRSTEPGQQASKSDRCKLTISYSHRTSDSVECTLTAGNQPELPLNGPAHNPEPYKARFDGDGNELPSNLGQSSPGADDAGTTSLGDALDAAAAATGAPRIQMALDEPGWVANGLLSKFKCEAKLAKWSKAQISLMVGLIKKCGDDAESIKTLLRPHVAGDCPLPEDLNHELPGEPADDAPEADAELPMPGAEPELVGVGAADGDPTAL